MANKPEDKKEEGPDAKHRISVAVDAVDKAAAEIAGTVFGFPVDVMNWGLSFVGLNSEKPVGGSKWISEKVGGVTETQNKAMNFTPPEHVDATDKVIATTANIGTKIATGWTALKLLMPGAVGVAAGTQITTPAMTAAAAPSATSFAGSVASASWWTAKTAAKVAATPVVHPYLTLAGVGAAHQLTDGRSTDGLIDLGVMTWDTMKEHAPGATEAVLNSGNYISQGLSGAALTVGERGIHNISEKLPFGTPLSLKAWLSGTEGGFFNSIKDGTMSFLGLSPHEIKPQSGESGTTDPQTHPTLTQRLVNHVEGEVEGHDPEVGMLHSILTALGGENVGETLSGAGPAANRFAEDNKAAIAIGALYAYNTPGGLIRKGLIASIVTLLAAPILNFISPFLKSMMKSSVAESLTGATKDFYGQYAKGDKPDTKNPLKFTKTEQKPDQTHAPVTAKPGENHQTIMGTDGKPVTLSDEHLSEPKISTVDVQQGTTKITKLFAENANDPIEKRVEARLQQHLADLRKENPSSPYLDPKNEEKYKTLMTKTFTAQIRDEESQAQKLAAQNNAPAKVYFQPQQLPQPLMLSMN